MASAHSTSSITIAVVGTGLIGPRHAQAVYEEPEAELFCIVDPNPAAQNVAERFGVEWFDSIQNMLVVKGKPNGAIVCTPNNSHVPVATELLDAGIHVLVEKPISTELLDGLKLVQHALRQNLKLLVGHHRRFNSYVSASKQILDKRCLGRIIAISGLWCTYKPPEYFEPPTEWRKGASGGCILINLIHEVDVLQYLFGPIVRVFAEKTISQRGFEAEEGVAILLRFESGIVGTFVLSDAIPSPHNFESGTGENPLIPKTGQDVYRIFGSEGTFSVPDLRLWKYKSGRAKSWTEPLTAEITTPVEERAPFKLQTKHFVEVMRGNENPVCTGEDGLRAVAVCDAVKRAISQDRPVDIEL